MRTAGFNGWGLSRRKLKPRKSPVLCGVQYKAVFQHTPPDEILNDMRAAHQKGARYFIMTMSDVVEDVVEKFKAWHQECLADYTCGLRHAPTLIVTVASAPGLCDAANGIVRWYIRSEEESRELAKHLQQFTNTAATFAITKTADRSDSLYGSKGTELFCRSFKHVRPEFKFYVTAKTAEIKVQAFISQCRADSDPELMHSDAAEAWPGVFIVGVRRDGSKHDYSASR